jgi:sugar lactone lactonase YvrE
MTRITLRKQTALAVLAIWLAASAALAAAAEDAGNLVWPSPPLEARIRYVGSYATPADVGREKGFWRKLWEFIRGEDEFERVLRPMAVATDGQERILVADTRVKRLHIFDRRKKEYAYIAGAGEETFLLPIAVAVDGRDHIYVADGERRRIYVFKPDGEFDHVLKGTGELGRPSSLAIDRVRQRLYVADVTRHQIRVIDLATERQIATIGKRGEQRGEFNFPSHVSVTQDGRLAVTDAMNMRIQLFDADDKPLLALGKHGDGSGDFTAPKGVALDSEGHIYVADAGFDNVQIFGGDGKLRLYWGSAGQKPGQFWMPAGLHIDAQNRIYVADSHNGRVQVFQYLGAGAKK